MWQLLRRLLVLGMLCLALSAMANPVWLNDANHLYVIDTATRQVTPVAANAALKAVAPTADGGAYILTARQLVALDAKATGAVAIDLTTLSAADITLLAADPFDATLWAVDKNIRVHHLNPQGQDLANFALAAPARAVALAQDQSLWVLGNTQLTHYAPNGSIVQTIQLPFALSDGPVRLTVDSLGSVLWISNAAQLLHIDLLHLTAPPTVIQAASGIRDLALEPKRGTLWALLDGALQSYDAAGMPAIRIDLAALALGNATAVAIDPVEGSLWVSNAKGVGRLSPAGELLPAPAVTAATTGVAAVPFWITPRLQLLEAIEGMTLNDPMPTFTLGVDALCAGVPCGFPPGFGESFTLSAALDQQDVSAQLHFAPGTGLATFTPRQALANGTHTFSAMAFDSFGHASNRVLAGFGVNAANTTQAVPLGTAQPSTTSTPAAGKNKPPTVTLSTNGTSFTSGASITLTANATDTDGTVAKVAFYRGGTTLIGNGVLTAGVWTYTWANVPAGSYALTAVATDNAGATGTSTAVNVMVTASTNNPPTVSITSPANGAVLATPANGFITASASDSNGTVAKVDFYDGSALLGTVNGNGMNSLATTQAFSNLALGAHTLKAVVTDNLGATATATVNITVAAAPIVVLTRPDCTVQVAPANIYLEADAYAPGGAIVKVEFYQETSQGSTLIDTAPYYQYLDLASYGVTWKNVSAGTYKLTAKAYDNRGMTATSAPFTVKVDAPPKVTLTAPASGATLTAGFPVGLAATASDSDGQVARVDFYAGYQLVGSSISPPYTATWTPTSANIGAVSLTAIAKDNVGVTTTSAAVPVNVVASQSMSVALTSPTAGATFGATGTIALAANAVPASGTTIAKVEFFQGTTLIGTAKASPYTANWPNVAPGSYTLTAKATDSLGKTLLSAPVAITVSTNYAPTVSITTPAVNNATYTAPASITLTADAADIDGTIAKVEFYQGSTLIGTASNTPPYTFTWPNVAAGTYLVTAKAIDDTGFSAVSAPRNIVVAASGSGGSTDFGISFPLDGYTFVAPAAIKLTAVNAGTNLFGTPQFYWTLGWGDPILIGDSRSADGGSTYTYLWNARTPGTYTLLAARWVYVNGTSQPPMQLWSKPVTITVVADPSGESITYLHNDVAGSAIAATDVNGAMIWKEDYRPYGERTINDALAAGNRQFFTGKSLDGETGLSYYGARYYDASAGRFMGVDPVEPKEGDVHSFNRYAYANNNPYRYVDPDGRDAVDIFNGFAKQYARDTLGIFTFGISNFVPIAGLEATEAQTGGAYLYMAAGMLAGGPEAGVAKGLAANVSWKGFSKGSLATHFEKHGAEFGNITQSEYLKQAKAFSAEAGAFLEQKVGSFIVKYDPATGRTLVGHAGSREIRTFYKADGRSADPFNAAVELAGQLSGR